MPIKNYVESCLSDVGEEAIIKLGMQGGYIDLPDEIRLNKAYVELLPRSLIKTPYWYYNGVSFVPSIETMQEEISKYVENNIKKCADLTIFQYDYKIEEKPEIEVETTIAEKDVDIRMNHELIIKNKATDEQTKVSKFYANIDTRLKETYELGKRIMEAENSETYFENITIDWISMNPDIPLNGIEFHCSELKWRVRNVKRELQEMAYYNIPKIRVKNTDHAGFLEDKDVYENLRQYTLEDIYEGNLPDIATPADAYEYSHYLIDARTKKTDLKAGFLYNLNWGMDLVVRPSEGGVMRSTKQSASQEFLSFLCLNTFHFTYDVIYPVEVLIRDDKSFGGNGYVFRYAFPVMINHNAPDREGFLNPEFIMIGGDFIGECNDLEGPEYDIRVLGLDDFGIANMELKDVNISYDCYRFKCDLGQTKTDQGAYRLRTQLPSSCANGFIIAEKQGYLKEKQQVLDNTDIDIELKKLKTLDFEVVMNDYNSNNGNIGDDKEIKSPFTAIIDIQSWDEPSMSYFRQFPFDETNTDKTIDLIEQNSKYKLDIMLFDEEDSIFIGGYQGNWTVRYSDIYDSEKVIFHVVNYLPKPMNREAESKALNFLDENNVYKDALKPEFR